MKQSYKKITIVTLSVSLVLLFLLSLCVPHYVNAVSGSNSVSAITLVGDDSVWTANSNSITGTLADKTTVQQTSTLTVSGPDNLAQIGTLSFKFTYSLSAGYKGSASFSTSVVGINSASKAHDGWGTGAQTASTPSTDIETVYRIENWTAKSSFTVTLNATGGSRKPLIGSTKYYESTARVEITEITFTPYTEAGVDFVPTEQQYTVSYYAEATDTEPTLETVLSASNENAKTIGIGLVEDKGITISAADANYRCVALSYTKEDGTSDFLYADANGIFKPETGWTVTPIFVYDSNGVAPFKVNGNYYWTWESAFIAAASSTKKVVLNDAYTLPAAGDSDILSRNGLSGDGTYVDFTMDANNVVTSVTYKVPEGFTFLVPYDAAFTELKSDYKPQAVNGTINDTSYNLPDAVKAGLVAPAVPYERGTLSVGKGSTIESNGTVIVNGQQWATMLRDVGSACGPYGLIKLADSTASLHIKSGVLVCYGYIIGSGQVTVDGGTKVYELMQIADWRGFTFALSWLGTNLDTSDLGSAMGEIGNLLKLLGDNAKELQKNRRSFLFSQYYVQNIEATLLIDAKATLNAVLTMNDTQDLPQFIVPFITSGNGFLKTSGDGKITREYDTATDRTVYRLNCDVTTGSLELSFGTRLMGMQLSANLDTKNNAFSVCNNLTFIVESGNTFTLATDMKLLPEATLIVEPDANVVIKEGVEFFLYDKQDWLDGAYACQADFWKVNHVASNYDATKNGAPFNRVIDESAKLIINGTLTIQSGANIFTTAGHTQDGKDTVADRYTEDKIVSGTGKIINYATIRTDADFGKLDEFTRGSGNFCYSHTIHTKPFVGKLAGVTDLNTGKYDSFGIGTYYGLGEAYGNYWYQYTVRVDGGQVDITSGFKTGKTSGIVAFVANSLDANGTVSFALLNADCAAINVTASSTATLTGGSTLSNFSGDCVVTIAHTIGEAGMCTGCGRFECQATNVRLGNSLDMLFAFPNLYSDADLDGWYVKIIHNDEPTIIPYSKWGTTTVNGVKCYYVIYSGLTASQMCDEVTVTVCKPDGSAASVVRIDSIQNYAMRMLANHPDNEALRTLLVDMLNYGTACQEKFKYQTGDLANALLNADQRAYATQGTPEASDDYDEDRNKTYWSGSNVLADTNTQFLVGFKNFTEGMKFTYELKNHWGKDVVQTITYENMTEKGSYHGLANVRLADVRLPITIKVYDANGVQVAEWTDSMEAYVARMIEKSEDDTIYIALLKFADAANAYLHSKEVV